jgi:hypothetical protein
MSKIGATNKGGLVLVQSPKAPNTVTTEKNKGKKTNKPINKQKKYRNRNISSRCPVDGEGMGAFPDGS